MGGQTGSEDFGCLEASSRELARDESAPIGFSANDVLSIAEGSHAITVTYADGSTTPATLEVVYDGAAPRFLEMRWQDDGSGQEIALVAPEMQCLDVLAIDVTLHLETEDGAFDERWTTTLRASSAESSTAMLNATLDSLQGSYEPSAADVEGSDTVRLLINATFDASAAHGSIEGQAESVEGSGPDGVASARFFEVATF